MLPRPQNRGARGWRKPLRTPWVEPVQGALPFAPETSLKATRGTRRTVKGAVSDASGVQMPNAPAGQCVTPKTLDLSGLEREPQIAIPRRAIAFLRAHPSFRRLGLVPTLAVAAYDGTPILYEHFLCPIPTDRPTRKLKAQVVSAANEPGFAIRYVRIERAPITPSNAAEDDWVPESPAIAVEPSWQQSDTAAQVAALATSASSQEGGLAEKLPATEAGSSGHVGDGPSRLAPATARPASQGSDPSVRSAAVTAASSSQEPDATARVPAAALADLATPLQSLPPNCELLDEDEPLEHELTEPDGFVWHVLTSNFGTPNGLLAGQQYMEMRVPKTPRLHGTIGFRHMVSGTKSTRPLRLDIFTQATSQNIYRLDVDPGPPKMNIKSSQSKGREITARAQAGMVQFGNVEVKASSSRAGELAQEGVTPYQTQHYDLRDKSFFTTAAPRPSFPGQDFTNHEALSKTIATQFGAGYIARLYRKWDEQDTHIVSQVRWSHRALDGQEFQFLTWQSLGATDWSVASKITNRLELPADSSADAITVGPTSHGAIRPGIESGSKVAGATSRFPRLRKLTKPMVMLLDLCKGRQRGNSGTTPEFRQLCGALEEDAILEFYRRFNGVPPMRMLP